jgi:protein tyrosine phosphatase (PTP) superfamily phosphohydrolase (DUF442 family)
VISNTRTTVVCCLTLVAAVSCAPKTPALPATTQPIATAQDLPGLRNFAWVTPFLARGGQPTPTGFSQLQQRGIKTVIDLRGGGHRNDVPPGMKSVQLPTNVSKPDLKLVIQFLRLVREPQNRPVFIHDEAGADRVGLYVAAYRLVEQGWSQHDAVVELNHFGFNNYWVSVPDFLYHLDAASVRKELSSPTPSATAPVSQASAAASEPICSSVR